MDVGVAAYVSTSPNRGMRGSHKTNLHVEFAQVGEVKERKEKYLTAKYGAHQMSLIRKRLGVEMWMYDQIQLLYEDPKAGGKQIEKEVDLDELLDIEDDVERKKYLQKQFLDCQHPTDEVQNFITDLLSRAKTL